MDKRERSEIWTKERIARRKIDRKRKEKRKKVR